MRYRAFLSYSHRDARRVARLHRWLENFRLPRGLVAPSLDGRGSTDRLGTVFRDRDELATAANLSDTLQAALDQSAALVVVCSPAAVASPWVAEEIRYFRRQYPQRPVFAFVVGGDPGRDPRSAPAEAALPLALLLQDPDNPEGPLGEPVAADARPEGDGFSSAALKLVAGLLGVGYDQLRQREMRRRQQRWAALGLLSALIAAAMSLLAWQAVVARDQARAAQALAELELLSERQTRDFLLSVFRLADAGEAQGNQVTVREVLDKAVERIDQTRFDRPVIRSRFLATMGQAYASLGLNQRSRELLQQSLELLEGEDASEESWAQFTESNIELADVLFDMGDYQASLDQLSDLGATAIRFRRALSPAQRVRVAVVRGDVLSYLGRDEEARTSYTEAGHALSRAVIDPQPKALLTARILSGQAMQLLTDGDSAAAGRLLAESAELLATVVGPLHPDTLGAVISLGSAAYVAEDYLTARSAWTRALTDAHRVYGRDSALLGTVSNNLGILLIELGETAEAAALVEAAVASDRRFRSAEFDDLAFSLTNLAVLRLHAGETEEAGTLLQEALGIAEDTGHRMLAPILVHQSEIRCAAGETGSGAALAARAVGVAADTYGDAHWRLAQARLALAYCRVLAGLAVDDIDTAAAIAVMRERFPAKASPYRERAEAQWARISAPR